MKKAFIFLILFILTQTSYARTYKVTCCEKKLKDPCCYTTTTLSPRGITNQKNQKNYSCKTDEEIMQAVKDLSNQSQKGTN